MGKNAVWEKIAALLNRNAQDWSVTDSNTWNITDGRIFPWWLWASNLGSRTSQVIGEGIKEVYLTQTQEHEVLFNFIRADNTQYPLFLGCRQRSGTSEVYMRIRSVHAQPEAMSELD